MSLAPDPVELEVSPEGVAILTLNRAAKRNALDELMVDCLSQHFETLKGADHVRVVFIRGAGGTFCAGADIDWMRRSSERSAEDNEADALSLARMLKHLHDLPQITVALVEGAAIGAGAGMVAACDVGVARKDAKFQFSEVLLGFAAATVAPYVVEAIGPRWAKALLVTAERFDGAYAEKMGLVQYCVSDVTEMRAMIEHISTLAVRAAPSAVAASKAMLRSLAGRTLDEGLVRETARRSAHQRATPEGREGLDAFLAKREPSWRT